MYRSLVGSHGLGSRDFDVEYELFDELTSRIRTLATVTAGRVELVVGSFDLALLNRLGDVVAA